MDKVKAKISDFRPQRKNANRHTQRGIGMLNKSMADHGFIGAMTSAADGEIFDGSARLETAYDRFGEEVEPIVIDADGTRPIIVRRTDIPSASDPRAKKLAIAANRIAQVDLDWDPELLKAIGEEVDISDLFFDNEIENLFEKLEEYQEWEPEEEDEDALAESLDNIGKVESRVKLGDIWQLGRHKIACGDSTIEANVRALLGDRFGDVGMVFTDPPYNVSYEGKTKQKLVIDNDSFSSSDDFYHFLLRYFSCCSNASKPGSAIYVCHADMEGENFRRSLREGGWLYKQSLVWVKQSLVLGRQDYHWKHEPILYGWKPGASHNWYSDRSQTTVWEFDRPTISREHPTMKPLDLVEYAIGNSSANGALIYDGFLGSGSTLIAAQQMKGDRTVYGFELSPDYCEVIIQRYENFTGDIARLVGKL